MRNIHLPVIFPDRELQLSRQINLSYSFNSSPSGIIFCFGLIPSRKSVSRLVRGKHVQSIASLSHLNR